MAVVLDLDGTILDTGAIEAAREKRNWKECVQRKNETAIFDGISDICAELRRCNVGIAVVTSSVSFYAEAMLSFHGVPYDVLIAYHDTRFHKPRPEPLVAAATCLGAVCNDVLSVGDSELDLLASKAAGMRAGAAHWNPKCHESEEWDVVLTHPKQLLTHHSNEPSR